jgi:hypothetical protein
MPASSGAIRRDHPSRQDRRHPAPDGRPVVWNPTGHPETEWTRPSRVPRPFGRIGCDHTLFGGPDGNTITPVVRPDGSAGPGPPLTPRHRSIGSGVPDWQPHHAIGRGVRRSSQHRPTLTLGARRPAQAWATHCMGQHDMFSSANRAVPQLVLGRP